MKYLPFPIWALTELNGLIVVSGGGGGKNYGLRNFINVYKMAPKLEAPISEFDT
jgi:hypothetical protein